MRLCLVLLFLLPLSTRSQTGPAGVGNSVNNVLWLKADAGTSSTLNATAISSWNDQSGNAINLSQTVAAQQPSYTTGVLNGFPAIQFDNVNGANVNDKLIGPDSPLLDNTSGYSFFMVSQPQTVDNNARVIISKRTTVAVDQSFMHFFFTGSRFYSDIQTNNNRYNTASTFTANTPFLIDQFFDGTLAMASRCRTYVGGTLDVTSAETSTLVADNVSPVILGSTDATDPRPFGGYIAEVIIYRTALNDASRIIIDNYLSAKYNIALGSNNLYLGDDAGNGNFDYSVCGVGQESSGSTSSFSSSVSDGLGLSVNSGLDNGDYILVGHNSFTNDASSADVGGMTGSLNARWVRNWYMDITNTATAINVDLEFDLSDGGVGSIVPGAASDYVLLYRSGLSGNWTELSTASSVSGDKISFTGITLTNDGYYTIGTHQFNASPLPLELTGFSGQACEAGVCLNWTTASEKNTAEFVVQRSKDGLNWETISTIKAAGQSSQRIEYKSVDTAPLSSSGYYRLKILDLDKSYTYSHIIYIEKGAVKKMALQLFPNPNKGEFTLHLCGLEEKASAQLIITDQLAKTVFTTEIKIDSTQETSILIKLDKKLPGGTYYCTLKCVDTALTSKLQIGD